MLPFDYIEVIAIIDGVVWVSCRTDGGNSDYDDMAFATMAWTPFAGDYTHNSVTVPSYIIESVMGFVR